MATFNYAYSPGPTKEVMPRVVQAKFGDGYEQRVADGINFKPRMWNVIFSGKSITDANNIDNFLLARGGVESFNWTPPRGAAGVFVCRKWTTSEDTHNSVTITATFEEVFGEAPAP